ncbi:MAG: ABC transporter permease [Tissierellia bacterium]|nr:ABC transporter permease [Tissierellia bacterium]
MKRYKWILDIIITILIVVTLNFFIPRLMPGDPFMYLEGEDGHIMSNFSEGDIQRYKEYYNMDKPLLEQYIDYLKKLVKLDLGYSIYYRHEVSYLIKSRLKWTIPLVAISILLSSFLGTVLGLISAWKRGSFFDRLCYFIMIILNEIPSFLIGVLFLFTLGAKYKLFPISGGFTLYGNFVTRKEKILDIIHHGVLPSLTLMLVSIGDYYLYARNSMINILSKDYIKTARAKGLKNRVIIFKHMLRNGIAPILTRIFLSFGNIVGGAVLVENVFAYPGLGKMMQSSIKTRDYPLLQGIFLVTTLTVLVTTIIGDKINQILDPRLKNG